MGHEDCDCLTVCPGCLVRAEELSATVDVRLALPGEACDGCHSDGVDYLDPTEEEPNQNEIADLEWEVF